MRVCVTLPAYNEAEYIGETIDDIKGVLDSCGYDYFIHVQDDGSDDDTVEVCRGRGCVVNSNGGKMGLAATFRNEMSNCVREGADIIVHSDADGQYPPKYIPELVEKLGGGYDLVIGSRFLSGIHYGGSRIKAYGNILFSKAVSLVSGSKCSDVTSGFRAMSREAAGEVDVRTEFTYTYGQYLAAVRRGLRVGEVPIEGVETRRSKLMKHPLEYVARAVPDILVNHILTSKH
jgi:glycosyltransferase involved in cell wall biosynthesis